MKKTGEEGDCKKKTGDRGGWRKIADEAVKKLQAHLAPDKAKKRKRELINESSTNACSFLDVPYTFF